LFPAPPPPESVQSCAVSGVLGAVPGVIGTLQAAEVIKLILGIGSGLTGRLLLVDILDMEFHPVRIECNPTCPVCGTQPSITELTDTELFCGSSILPGKPIEGPEISPIDLKTMMNSGVPLQILDVREPGESQISNIDGTLHIRLVDLPGRIAELDSEKEIVVYCRSGVRSMKAIHILQKAGYKKVHNLKGGINAWANEIDPTLPLY
jgi:adenylyltransferase/sulfurtransferase